MEIASYEGQGFITKFQCGAWIVSYLNWSEDVDRLWKLERHMTSDEVFILLKGSATLYIGLEKKPVPMEQEKIYYIPKAEWHAIMVSKDAKVIVVENQEVTVDNSEYIYF